MASDVLDTSQSDLLELDSPQFDDLLLEETESHTESSNSSTPSNTAQALYNKRPHKDRAKRSPELWKHARARLPHEPKLDNHGHTYFYCAYCDWRGISSNASRHLRTTHGRLIAEQQSLREKALQRTIGASFSKQEKDAQAKANDMVKNVLDNAIAPESYQAAVARLITSKSLSHNIVESPEWIAMCLTLNWRCKKALIKSHATVPVRITENFVQQRQVVKQHLRKATSCIHFSTDTWYAGTSFQKEFQAINAQFVNSEGVLQNALLALPELPSGHAGAAVAPFFIEVLATYEIEDCVGWITGDNSGTNDTMCRAIEEHLSNNGYNYWQADQRRLWCVGHTINLPVQTFLFAKSKEAVDIAKERAANSTISLDEALAELSQTDEKAGWSRQSSVYKIYRLAVALRNMRLAREFKQHSGRLLDMPNETRWNSWYRLIEEALQTRASIVAIIDAHSELDEYHLTADDWQVLKDTSYFLQPFNRATKLCEGKVTLDKLQDAMDMLGDHYKDQEAKHSANEGFLAAINTSWIHFNEYYERLDTNSIYITAQLLHPSKRLAHLKKKRWPVRWQKEAIARSKKLWSEYKQRFQPLELDSNCDTGVGVEPDFFDQWQRRNEVVPADDDDFTAFINAAPTRLATGTTSLSWWSTSTQRAAYPALSRLAIDALSAMPMSAESERIFSRARRTVDWQRARLGGVSIEHAECSKDWQLSGIAYCPIDDHLQALEALQDDPIILTL